MSKTINIGIDLGTTNSGIARYENGDLNIIKHPISLKETIPSTIAFRKDRTIVGDKAREYVTRDPSNVFALFKRKMGTDHQYHIQSQDRSISPIELSSIILKELKNFASGEEVPNAAVITIPAAFDTVQSNATKEAGQQAGFDEVVLLQEPIAASMAYANRNSIELNDKKWIVYDLGGGTFDVALMEIRDGEMRVIDHEGDNYLGGTDFDHLIIEQLFLPKLQETGAFVGIEKELKLKDSPYAKLYHLLLYKAEEAKKELSAADAIEVELDVEDENGDFHELFFTISRIAFEAIIRPIVQRTLEFTRAVILQNQLAETEIDYLFLVGGSTYVPMIKQALSQAFDISIDYSVDPTTAVTIGAAFFAGSKSRSQKKPKKAKMETPHFDRGTSHEINIKSAFHKYSTDTEELLLLVTDGNTAGMTYRISRSDGGYDSGKLALKEKNNTYLPLLPDALNQFLVEYYDGAGNRNPSLQEIIEIIHGKYVVNGQPLPYDICLEVDSPEDGRSYLEPIFKKNAILPLKKTITKQAAKNIRKDSPDQLSIHVFEGAFDAIPAASKLIGKIVIKGDMLERDIVKGSDVEIEVELSESRDLLVRVYVSMTEQEFEDVFSSSQSTVDIPGIIRDLKDLKRSLQGKRAEFERSENYEMAQQVSLLRFEIEELVEQALQLDDRSQSDEKYQLDLRKREIAAKVGRSFEQSLLTTVITSFMNTKSSASKYVQQELATEEDRQSLKSILSNADTLLKEGSISRIKYKTKQLQELISSIQSRREVTMNELVLYFSYYKNLPFRDSNKAQTYIIEGESALDSQNQSKLLSAVNQLAILHQKENPGGAAGGYQVKTGLK